MKKLTIVYGPKGSGKTTYVNSLVFNMTSVTITQVEPFKKAWNNVDEDVIIVREASTEYLIQFCSRIFPDLNDKHRVIIEVQSSILPKTPHIINTGDIDFVNMVQVNWDKMCEPALLEDTMHTPSTRKKGFGELASDIRHALNSEKMWIEQAYKKRQIADTTRAVLLEQLQKLPDDLKPEGINTYRCGFDVIQFEVENGNIKAVEVIDYPDLEDKLEELSKSKNEPNN